MAQTAVLQHQRERRVTRGLSRTPGCYAIAVREAWAMLDAGELNPGQFLALCYEAAQAEAQGDL
jgi:hypothetical protein